MIYQRTLKQINTVFPKLSLKPPVKKAIVRSLIQQQQCPNFSSNDIQQLKNIQTASKIISKLFLLISTWLRVSQSNQKCRQQYLSRPVSRDDVENMEYLLLQCKQINGKSDFLLFLTQKAQPLYERSTSSSALYRQTLIVKQIEFYNTITQISQEQYLKDLQQVQQKLNIYLQLLQNQKKNLDHLQELCAMIDNDQLFKKKDNILHRIIKYNLIKAGQLIESIQNFRKIMYFYEDALTFSIVRCYYLIYCCEQDVRERQTDHDYLAEIQAFITERQEWIFIKLYARKIVKPILLLQKVRQQSLYSSFQPKMVSSTEISSIKNSIKDINQFLSVNQNKALSQQTLRDIYPKIQSLIVQINKQLQKDTTNQEIIQSKRIILEMEKQVVRLFVEVGVAGEGSGKSNKVNGGERRYLKPTESHKKQGYRSPENRSNKSYMMESLSARNTQKTIRTQQNTKEAADKGDDIFLLNPLQKVLSAQEQKKAQQMAKNSSKVSQQCQKLLMKILPQFGQHLSDAKNINYQELNLLVSTLNKVPASENQKIKNRDVLAMVGRSLTKPQISEQNIEKMFIPKLRVNPLKMFSQKLVELGYKNSKIMDTPQFESLPPNIKKFIQTRNQYLKSVNRHLDKIFGIAAIISNLQLSTTYQISNQDTYQTFLKILLALKQVQTYSKSFLDQKTPTPSTSSFITNKLYQPFIQSLNNCLPSPYNSLTQIVQVLDQIQFFVDFLKYTEEILDNFGKDIGGVEGKEEIQREKRELGRVLGKWSKDAGQRMEKKRENLSYTKAQQQLNKVNQIIKVCNGIRTQIRDPSAIQIQKILDSKL